MRKLFFLLLFCVGIFLTHKQSYPSFAQAPTTSPLTSPVLRNGDVNNDGVVNLTDIRLIIQNVLGGFSTLFDQYGDGRINAMDFVRVLKQMASTLPTATPTMSPGNNISPLIHIPYFSGTIPFEQTAIFWFGKITPTENYTDVRIGYNDTELYVYLAVFDKRLWYDTTPTPAEFKSWDSVSMVIDTNTNPSLQPGSTAYRFDAEWNPNTSASGFQAGYKGNGSTWSTAALPFTTTPGWRGDAWNNDIDDRGWVMTYHIPFTSLGLSTKPSDNTKWRLGFTIYDRDDSLGTAIPVQVWPENNSLANPTTWGTIAYSLPTYSQAVSSPQTVTIQHRLNNQTVLDAAVGGDTICGGSNDYWTQWGNVTDGTDGDFNIQNQSDIADWPCFSKYYITFPLTGIPANKKIASAKLQLHLFGNAGAAGQATPSFMQVARIDSDFSDTGVTWNTAPNLLENYSYAWVNPMQAPLTWPGELREWDISRAVADAYTEGVPLRLVIYSMDSDYHSGKYFVSSDTGDWNAAARPTLQISYGN